MSGSLKAQHVLLLVLGVFTLTVPSSIVTNQYDTSHITSYTRLTSLSRHIYDGRGHYDAAFLLSFLIRTAVPLTLPTPFLLPHLLRGDSHITLLGTIISDISSSHCQSA